MLITQFKMSSGFAQTFSQNIYKWTISSEKCSTTIVTREANNNHDEIHLTPHSIIVQNRETLEVLMKI
jgi:hypothetical protein